MKIVDLIILSWAEFKKEFDGLVVATAPFFLGSIALEFYQAHFLANLSTVPSILYQLVKIFVDAGLIFTGLRKLFEARNEVVHITSEVIFYYVIAYLVISMAVAVGFTWLVLPGLVIMVCTYLVPIFILKEGNGPIEAVFSSASYLRPLMLQLLVLFVLIWALFFGAVVGSGSQAGFILQPATKMSLLIGVLGAFLALFNLCFMVNVYASLRDAHSD